MEKTKKIPNRTCIVCKKSGDKKQFIRIVKNKEGEIFLDKTSKSNGRGAYCCDNEECVKKLRKTRALNRTFKCEVDSSVYDSIEEAFFDR